MLIVPRYVRKATDPERSPFDTPPRILDEFRDQAVWVLLGEPGSGKTETFKKEAEATGGKYLSIAEFIDVDGVNELQGKTLFLDGLDEVRAGSGGESILRRIQARLGSIGRPRLRIACRAADWFGSTDREEIKGALPDGEMAVLLLEPLAKEDIFSILRENHGVEDPGAFVEKARRRGVVNLLDNPQTLELLANAIRDDQWPTTRQDTFRLACKKLVEEANKRHRDKNRSHPESTEKLLDAAGHLCAVLLLSDKTGVALDPEQADARFPFLNDCAPSERELAYEAVRSKLFRPEGEERFVPSHRSIAEYLAARWLAVRIDRDGLPLGRVLNLMLGRDGRTVAGLRGLYGWLALQCQAARSRLLDADPLTAVVYGDAKPLPPADKRRIINGLRREAERYAGFRWDISPSHPFGALAAPELADDFIAALESPGRDEATQAFADCILVILAEGEGMPRLAGTLRRVAVDDTRWGRVRQTALRAWLKLAIIPGEALALLDAITDGEVMDADDDLADLLLRHLYPGHLTPETLLRYLHVSRSGHLGRFWRYELPRGVPDSHLPILLDQLAARTDLFLSDIDEFHLPRMVAALLAKGLILHGNQATAERLFSWLGIGADKYGQIHREEADRREVAGWLEARPARYKALLLRCFNQCEGHEHPRYCIDMCKHRLHGAAVPDDIGLWHLEQVTLAANDAAAQEHLSRAIEALMYQRGSLGLSLEKIEAWSDAHPKRKHWLQALLAWEIPEWRIGEAARKYERKQQHTNSRRERTIEVSKHIPAIHEGGANAALMHQLAGVWMTSFSDISGDTPAERFDNYSDNGRDLLAAAEAGFPHCPERTDLPTAAEIIDLATNQREHYLRLPCLAGMELRWGEGPSAIHSLSDDALRRMLAFQLTYGGNNTPDWFTYLVVERPVLVAGVLVEYASATLKSKQGYIDSIYPLEWDPNYRMVAVHAVPLLLERFPVRAKANHLSYLKHLLKSALLYRMEQLPALVKKKMALKSMDVAQKVYWLAAGMLRDPGRHEADLWRYIGHSWIRANHLSGFLRQDFGKLSNDYPLLVGTIGKLIELLAPHAEVERPRGGGWVTDSMQRGDHVRVLISHLRASATEDAADEIERLLALPALNKLKFSLENARNQLRLKQRESEFRFISLAGVTQVLANQAPADGADLTALVLDHLDDIAQEIRRENDDGFRAFWNIEKKRPTGKREENYCRDELLRRLRARLGPLGVDCQPEGDCFNDKRADIGISYRNEMELPIELKRDDNPSLWSALRSQLIDQYSIAPRAAGHGVYLVLWFGEKGMPAATDGGKKPRSPEELKTRLEAQLDATEQRRIFVRVLDVSWPAPVGMKR